MRLESPRATVIEPIGTLAGLGAAVGGFIAFQVGVGLGLAFTSELRHRLSPPASIVFVLLGSMMNGETKLLHGPLGGLAQPVASAIPELMFDTVAPPSVLRNIPKFGVSPYRKLVSCQSVAAKTPSPNYADTVSITFTPVVTASSAQTCTNL